MNRILLCFFLILMSTSILLSQNISTFDDANIGQDTFWNGSDLSNPSYAIWTGGWALSSVQDSVTSGFGNLYAAKTLQGFESETYAVGQQNSIIKLQEPIIGQAIDGLYITNTTYAHNSMRDGDGFAKEFGGDSGDDPDYFRLTIRKYLDGILSTDSVDFYLADYRFEDNSQDYIVDTWEFVDLSDLGNVDSLHFQLSSTDTSGIWLNTPAFFCIDQLTPANASSQNDLSIEGLEIFPNPAADFIQIIGDEQKGQLSIYNVQGQLMLQKQTSGNQQIDITQWPRGNYFVSLRKGQSWHRGQFVK